jgi:hypothetical protein
MRSLYKRRSGEGAGRQRMSRPMDVSDVSLFVKNTSPYPTERVRELLHFSFNEVYGIGVEIHVKGSSRTFRGRAYDGVPRMANVLSGARYLVTIGLAKARRNLPDQVGPGTKRLKCRYPHGLAIESWEDLLIYVAAHEARHIWQFQARHQGVVHPISEVDADEFAIQRLNEWRQTSGRAVILAQK